MTKSLLARLSALRMTILIVVVILASVIVVSYVLIEVKQVEEELPLRVMREKRDMEQVARNFYRFLAVTDAARVHPTEGNLESVRQHLQVVAEALRQLRERYAFDTLIGASALHSVLSPALDDIQIWLQDGFSNLSPSSSIVLELVVTRGRDALVKVYDKTTEADRIAYEILEQQTGELRQLRTQLILPLVALGLLAAGIVWLARRQQRAALRQAEAEAASVRAQAQLRQAIESISEGFALFDSEERLILCNTRYREMLRRRDDVIGAPIAAILCAAASSGLVMDAVGREQDWLDERLSSFRNPTEPHVYQLADKRWIQVNERKTEGAGTVAVYSDITELKAREFELLMAMEHAEAASLAKGEFLANVSHELRTPLTSILGFTRMIQRRFEERILPTLEIRDPRLERAVCQVSENLKIIRTEGARLTNLINNVLDLAKIEAGEMTWNIQALAPAEIVGQAASAMDSIVREKGLTFSIEIPEGLPDFLGDRDKVVQVIVNLVANAAKFTDEGGIVCRARRYGNNQIVISVADTGCGISESDRDTVFEQFKQVGDSLIDKPTGTGLGLPICKEIIGHLNGKIWVESKVNVGSEFYFTLPLAA